MQPYFDPTRRNTKKKIDEDNLKKNEDNLKKIKWRWPKKNKNEDDCIKIKKEDDLKNIKNEDGHKKIKN